jgi:hypothetical protein
MLLLAARAGREIDEARHPRGALVLLGLLGGLALWTHLMSASVLAAVGLWLAVRARRHPRLLVFMLVPFLVASAPLWTRALRGGQATRIVQVATRDGSALAHLAEVAPRIYEPLGGLLGTHVPVVAWSWPAAPPGPGTRRASTSSPPGWPCWPFPSPREPPLTPFDSSPLSTFRWRPSWRGPRRALHLAGATRLLGEWRNLDRAEPPFLLPDLAPVRDALAERGVRHAYASYGPAWRLTWESGERIVASQPWNERFRHWPLPLLDEVRFAKNVAWVLTPDIPTDLPPPDDLEETLRRWGGRWRRIEVGPAVVFLDFVPPHSPRVRPWPGAGAAGDGDPRTFVAPDPEAPFELRLPEPTELTGITLVAALDGPRLLRSMDVAVSADGETFETLVRRRRREERSDIRWRGGTPQAILDHDVIAIPLGGRTVSALRIVPHVSSDPWRLGEVLIHSEPARQAWDEWLSPTLDWTARRRALAESPHPDREDWYSRQLIAEWHRPPP